MTETGNLVSQIVNGESKMIILRKIGTLIPKWSCYKSAMHGDCKGQSLLAQPYLGNNASTMR